MPLLSEFSKIYLFILFFSFSANLLKYLILVLIILINLMHITSNLLLASFNIYSLVSLIWDNNMEILSKGIL